MMAFIVWGMVGVLFVGLGIYACFSHAPVGFWANAEKIQVEDVKKYNRATAKLFCAYGVVFVLLGIPLLPGQNPGAIIFSMLGVMFESIVAMAVYTTVIEKKYKKRGEK